jgi:hypothetical protein
MKLVNPQVHAPLQKCEVCGQYTRLIGLPVCDACADLLDEAPAEPDTEDQP